MSICSHLVTSSRVQANTFFIELVELAIPLFLESNYSKKILMRALTAQH